MGVVVRRLLSRGSLLVRDQLALFVSIAFLGISLARGQKPPLLLSIVPTASSADSSTISMAHDAPWTFYVVVTNISNEPVTVWEDGNSWGYRVISFEGLQANGQKIKISKQPHEFGKNTPRTFVIRPDEQKVYEVKLDGEWAANPPLPRPAEMSIRIKACYDASPTPEGAKLKVWVGHVESKYYDLPLRQW